MPMVRSTLQEPTWQARPTYPATAFHHTFVMKLFDRSVDLAQFPDFTPLYPVCRAWMKNDPHNTNMAPRLRTPTPEPDQDEEKEDSDQNPDR